MTTPQKEYRELLSLTQSYLLAEFKSRQQIFSEPESYEFFKQYQPKPNKVQPAQPPQQLQPAPNFQAPPRQHQPIRQDPQQSPAPPPPQQPQPKPPQQQTQTHPVAEKKPPEVPKQKETAPSAKTNRKFTLKLEPMTEVKEIELASIKKDFEKQFPDKQIVANPPDDAVAKKMGQQWKQEAAAPQVVILSFQEHPDRQVFLQNMKTAINQRLAPCAIYSAQTIESKQAWDKLFAMKDLRLIVTTDYGMYSLPGLMRHYRESPEKSQRYLGGVPLLLLTDISLYLKQPQLKAALWQALCTMLPKPNIP